MTNRFEDWLDKKCREKAQIYEESRDAEVTVLETALLSALDGNSFTAEEIAAASETSVDKICSLFGNDEPRLGLGLDRLQRVDIWHQFADERRSREEYAASVANKARIYKRLLELGRNMEEFVDRAGYPSLETLQAHIKKAPEEVCGLDPGITFLQLQLDEEDDNESGHEVNQQAS